MIRSMTGFGRTELAGETVAITVEARSVNHRHLDISLRLPNAWSSLEGDVRRIVQSRVERGRVDVSVQVSPLPTQSTRTVRVDSALARHYVEQARQLAREIGVGGDVDLGWILGRPGVIELTDAPPADASAVWPLVAAARREERLRERMGALLADTSVDEARVATEVAVWATKTDVTEELARLRVHLDEFGLMLDKGGSVGRQLDFLIQEMNREVNTVGSKADDLELSQAALGAKGLLEKIREQVQNLE